MSLNQTSILASLKPFNGVEANPCNRVCNTPTCQGEAVISICVWDLRKEVSMCRHCHTQYSRAEQAQEEFYAFRSGGMYGTRW